MTTKIATVFFQLDKTDEIFSDESDIPDSIKIFYSKETGKFIAAEIENCGEKEVLDSRYRQTAMKCLLRFALVQSKFNQKLNSILKSIDEYPNKSIKKEIKSGRWFS